MLFNSSGVTDISCSTFPDSTVVRLVTDEKTQSLNRDQLKQTLDFFGIITDDAQNLDQVMSSMKVNQQGHVDESELLHWHANLAEHRVADLQRVGRTA